MATLPPFGPTEWFFQIPANESLRRIGLHSQNLFRQNPIFTSLHLRPSVYVAPPLCQYSISHWILTYCLICQKVAYFLYIGSVCKPFIYQYGPNNPSFFLSRFLLPTFGVCLKSTEEFFHTLSEINRCNSFGQ